MRRLQRSPVAEIAPAGWYTHPERPEEEWYWDGRAWTEGRWAAKLRRETRVVGAFRVAFDGHWQEGFDTLSEAVEYAQEVASTGRLTWVIERRRFSHRFRTAFPQERTQEAIERWKWALRHSGSGTF